MFLRRLGRIGQSTADYAILFALVVAVAVGIQTLVKRGLQGRVRNAVDYTGNDLLGGADTSFGFTGEQYEPYYMDSDFASTRASEGKDTVLEGGAVERDLTKEESTRTGTQIYKAPE